MKKNFITVINLTLLITLCTLNIFAICDKGINDGSLIMLVFAIIFISLYIGGVIFPNAITKAIYSICLKLYKNSDNIRIPVFIEAKRTFIRRLKYMLICCNICLLISLITYLFH